MITLYDYELSAECYKARLLMNVLGLERRSVPVDVYPGREHESDWFLKLNPLGELPVIEDDGFVLADTQAILVYVAAKYGRTGRWYPREDPQMLGEIAQWLAFAAALASTAGAARLHDSMFYELDIEAARNGAHRLCRVLDEHLWFGEQAGYDWICAAPHPTIADIACFPDVMLSEEGGIPRQDYPAIRRWCDRVKRIEGFVVMAGIFPAGPSQASNFGSTGV